MKKYDLKTAPDLNPDLRNSLNIMKKIVKETDEQYNKLKESRGLEYEECLHLLYNYERVHSLKYYVEVHAEAQGRLKIRNQTEDYFHHFEKRYAELFQESWFLNKVSYLAQKVSEEKKEALLALIKWAKNYKTAEETSIEHKVIKETRNLDKIWERIHTKNKYVFFTPEELEKHMNDYLPSAFKQSKKKARELGLNGFAVCVNDEYYDLFLTDCTSREKREALWKLKYDNTNKFNKFEAHMAYLIDLNTQKANAAGYKTLAEKKFKKDHNPDPKVIEDFLIKGIVGLKPQVMAFRKSLEKYASSKFGIDEIQPWDRAFLFENYKNRYNKDYKSDEDKYPIRQTILKAVKLYTHWFNFDLVGYEIPKSNYQGIPNPKQTFWRFHLKDGDRDCYLDIGPYVKPRDRENFHAFCQEIGTSFNSGHGTTYGHCVIRLEMDPKGKGFDQIRLTDFCHELGHAFHYLSLNNTVAVWDGRNMQGSTIEFPSQLMELISRNPWVRSHLAKHSLDNISKMDTKEWIKKYSKQNKIKAYEESMDLLHALWDLKLHNEPGYSPIALRQELMKEHQLDFGEEHEPYFPWHFDSQYNGEVYSYAWSVGLVEFITEQYFTSHPRTENFKKLVQEYKERLLSKTGQYSFKEAWDSLFYTSMEGAAMQGLKIKNQAIKQGKFFI